MTRIKNLERRPSLRQRLLANQDGIAAMEFALIAPFIIGVYLGLAEISLALGADRQVAHSASVAGDMVAQDTEIEPDNMADIISAAMRVSQIDDPANYTLHLQSFEKDSDGKVISLGSAVYNAANAGDLPKVDPKTFGPELLSEDSGVVVARVVYKYQPLGFRKLGMSRSKFLPNNVKLRETFMLKPRRSFTVDLGGENVEMTCLGSSASSITCSQTKAPTPPDDDDAT